MLARPSAVCRRARGHTGQTGHAAAGVGALQELVLPGGQPPQRQYRLDGKMAQCRTKLGKEGVHGDCDAACGHGRRVDHFGRHQEAPEALARRGDRDSSTCLRVWCVSSTQLVATLPT
jgi:hypothetical protein